MKALRKIKNTKVLGKVKIKGTRCLYHGQYDKRVHKKSSQSKLSCKGCIKNNHSGFIMIGLF